jgi:hypothetical protein
VGHLHSGVDNLNLVMAKSLPYIGQRLEAPLLVVHKVFTPESNIVKVDIRRMEMIYESNATNRQVIQTNINKLLGILLY